VPPWSQKPALWTCDPRGGLGGHGIPRSEGLRLGPKTHGRKDGVHGFETIRRGGHHVSDGLKNQGQRLDEKGMVVGQGNPKREVSRSAMHPAGLWG
jgi:hypothetical protein